MAEPEKRPRRSAPIIEAAGMVGALVIVNLVFFRKNPGFVELAPHPSLFIVLFVLSRYGLRAGLWAALISAIGHASTLLWLVDVPSLYHLLAAPYATPIVILVPTTVILGLVVERHLERMSRANERLGLVENESEHLKEEIAKLRDVNVDLAGKVVGADATFQRLYRYARFLNVTDVEQIYQGLTLMLVEVLGADLVSVWEPRAHEMHLITRRGQAADTPPFKLDNLALAYFDAHGVLSLHDVPEANRHPGLPYLVGRIHRGRGGPLAAYVTIEKISFARYNAESIRFFTLAVDWVSSSIGNALSMAATPKPGATLSKTIFDAESGYPARIAGPPPRGAVSLGILLEEVDRYLRDGEDA
jgi:polysaccharide biosynthesis protein PelD